MLYQYTKIIKKIPILTVIPDMGGNPVCKGGIAKGGYLQSNQVGEDNTRREKNWRQIDPWIKLLRKSALGIFFHFLPAPY